MDDHISNNVLPAGPRRQRVNKAMRRLLFLTPFLLALGGCDWDQSTLVSHGPAAHRIANLQWGMLILFCVATLVMWILIALTLRKRGSLEEHAPVNIGGGQGWVVWGSGFILVILAVLLVLGLSMMNSFPIHNPTHSDTPPSIAVIGHQWWWEVDYLGYPSGPKFTTANEIHIPAGQPVTLKLETADVIHSFWIPALHGKVDMIPGHTNFIRIQANQPGVYQGQCSIYCGKEHALMRLVVVADAPARYQAWLQAESHPGADPTTPDAVAGKQVFLSAACVACHTVRGTTAQGVLGPDLTHIGSRLYLASDVFPNNDAYLAAWIVHAQSLKPGALMPNLPDYTGKQLLDMVAYLRQLK